MRAYILRRVAQSALTLLGVSVLVFVILRVLPGDPARMLLPDGAPESAVAELNRQLGLREPLIVQYGLFLRSVARGDFGQSFQYRAPALRVVVERLPATIELTVAAMLAAVLIGIPVGILAAVRRGSLVDRLAMVGALAGQSMATFWIGILLILLFSVWLKWFPVSGRDGLPHLVLPALTLSLYMKGAEPAGRGVLADWSTEEPHRTGLQLRISGDGHFEFQSWPAGAVLRSKTAATAAAWRHLVVTKSAGAAVLYVNGVEEDRGSPSSSYTLLDQRLYVGAEHGGRSAIHGSIDEFLVWNRALTAKEAADLFRLREAGPCKL
jgi:hypothetical protein